MDLYIKCDKCDSLLSSCKCRDEDLLNSLRAFESKPDIILPPPPEPWPSADNLYGWRDPMTPYQVRPHDYGKPILDISGPSVRAPGMNMYIPNYFTGIG